MQQGTLQATLVEKENIIHFQFPKEKVLVTTQEEELLRKKLWRATRLGNIEHNKVKLYFEDKEGMKVVHTTVWATGDKNIVLKRGVTIPINRVHDVAIL